MDLSSPPGYSVNDAIPVDICHTVTALPFGLRSAPKIFSAVAHTLAWILLQLHYLDDFLLLGQPGSAQWSPELAQTLQGCQELVVPIVHHKTEGPSCQLMFLGIHIDTVQMELNLPRDKLTRITAMHGAAVEEQTSRVKEGTTIPYWHP